MSTYKPIDTVQDLINALQEYPLDMPVRMSWSESECTGHPDGSYCYCGYAAKEETISYLCVDPPENTKKKIVPREKRKLLLKAD